MRIMLNYEENKKILLAEEALEKLDVRENFELLTEQDIFALKSIYDYEYVNTNMIHRYLKGELINYKFKNRLRNYINLGFIRSYYILSEDGERTSNIHVLTNEAIELIEEHFSLDKNNKNYINKPTDNEILFILKKLALNQFLIGSKDLIREYKLLENKHVDSLVCFKNNVYDFYVKVLRSNNNTEDMHNTIKYVESIKGKYKKVIFIFESLYHLEEISGPYLLPKYRKSVLLKVDSWVFDFPESYVTIDYDDNNYTVIGQIKIWELKKLTS